MRISRPTPLVMGVLTSSMKGVALVITHDMGAKPDSVVIMRNKVSEPHMDVAKALSSHFADRSTQLEWEAHLPEQADQASPSIKHIKTSSRQFVILA